MDAHPVSGSDFWIGLCFGLVHCACCSAPGLRAFWTVKESEETRSVEGSVNGRGSCEQRRVSVSGLHKELWIWSAYDRARVCEMTSLWYGAVWSEDIKMLEL